ncbi:hypothetical protein ENSA5_66670 [Enhygromyxa salina]|uniref:Glycosyltransferase RgtA/B/C/D-like domain-containing protein n=1 Tax=Enhygromyxa salina TaxID=215803 RepID=A0A2S9XBL7_9BACT|nr:hypothetical protein [Enhygromyxa salina]PRP90254.1 hypothetical protein ENSA5_66670 [Enhygromyxa salina]
MGAPDSQAAGGPRPGPSRTEAWVLWSLIAAAVVSRLVWVVWVHPPRDHVFSDMAHYVYRARLVAALEVHAGAREMAWQAWGTHALLAIPIVLLGPGQSALELAGLMWAGLSAATVVLGYRLAARVLPGGQPHWPAIAVGLALLVWVPLVSHTGFFVSETPYTCMLLATTLGAVRLIQDGRGATSAGVSGAVAFVLRPQSAVFFALLGAAWLLDRRHRDAPGGSRGTWSRRVDTRAALLFALPLAVALAISMIRVRVYTGEFGGVAENASMNLTAGRCHNIVTRAYPSEAARASAEQTGSPRADRRISLPGFRALGREGPDHPLALRPALGGESIDVVGYIGDRGVHREVRRRCYAATGVGGQLRYSVSNVALLWIIARPWPESSDRGAPELLPLALRGRDLAASLAPLSLLGMILALVAWARASPRPGSPPSPSPPADPRPAGLGVCALQLLSLLITAAVFFGTPRLRTPYDPYALVLATALVLDLLAWLWTRRRRVAAKS